MPTDQPSFIKTVRTLIEENDFEQAIDQLRTEEPAMPPDFGRELSIQASTYRQVRGDNRNGIISYDQYLLQTNRIRLALLDLLQQIALKKAGLVTAAHGPEPARPAAPPAVGAVPKFILVYDAADKKHAELLNRHLNVLKFTKRIALYDVHADPGADEDPVARAAAELAGADYVLCLVSINLTSSPDWFPFALDALANQRRVIPLRVENADIEGTGLEKLKGLPTMNRVINDFAQPDAAYKDIVDELKKLLPRS